MHLINYSTHHHLSNMDSHTNAVPNPSVDNELHHDGAENVQDFEANQERRMARHVAATLRRIDRNNTPMVRRPQPLASPFRTPSPGSSKRSHDSMDDDTTPRPHQRARLDYQPPSPHQEDAGLHQQRQAVALPPVLGEQEQEPENAAPVLPPFDAFLHGAGLTREATPRLQDPFPLLQQYRLRRAEHAAAQPPPLGREHRLLPEPNPGVEHFAPHHPQPLRLLLQPFHPPSPAPPEDPDLILPPPAALGEQPGPQPQVLVDDNPPRHAPAYAHHENDGDYDANEEQHAPPPPPQQQALPWVLWQDMTPGHREAHDACEDWEERARELTERMDRMIGRAKLRTFGYERW